MWRCGSYSLDTGRALTVVSPLVMGIVNVTPDSFSDGGKYREHAAAVAHARQLVAEGADIIDVGGESTRPGSDEVPISEELERVVAVIEQLAVDDIVVSVDTRHSEVAAAAVQAGAAIINDVSGFRDPAMVELAAKTQAGLIVMHMFGEPKGMQQNPHYDDVVQEVSAYLLAQAQMLEQAGVNAQRIAIDPGPGFGKTVEHNLELLRATDQMAELLPCYPLVAAYSRKTFIGKLTGIEDPAQRVAGSVACAVYAAKHGASVLRVHDVAPTVQALNLISAL